MFYRFRLPILFFIFSISYISCIENKNRKLINASSFIIENRQDLPQEKITGIKQIIIDYDTSHWLEIKAGDQDIIIDIKYATVDNFTKNIIYPCARCFLEKNTGQAILEIAKKAKLTNHRVRLFDCYRPRPAQQKLWDIVPDKRYVSPPAKGSMHNRGLAVDLTLTYKNGLDLNMGTAYDYFGRTAWPDYQFEDKQINANRILLNDLMFSQGFKAISSEWWHFNYPLAKATLSSWEWPCPNK